VKEHEKMEFWNSLARLYDDILALKEETLALRAIAEAQQKAAQDLRISCEALRDTAVTHDKRLVHIEVVQQWLAEKERNRELGGQ
jgi:hypothetical protein